MKNILSHIYTYSNYLQKPNIHTNKKNNVIVSRIVDGNYKPNITTYQIDYNRPNNQGLVCYIRQNY